MANDNLVRAILELDLEHSKLDAGLVDVVKQYGKVNDIIQDQSKKLQELIDKEAKLIEARNKNNNPTILAKYNAEILKTQSQIKALTVEQNKLTASTKTNTTEVNNLGKALKNAFTATQMAALKKELKELGIEVKSVSNGAKTFLKETKEGGEKSTDAFKKLKEEIRKARIELAEAFSSGDQAKIDAASQKLGKLKNDFKDLNEAAKQFETNSKFTQISKSLGNIATSILSLDFEKSSKQAKTLLEISKSMTFAEATKGITDLGSTLINVGKSLLINPIFLLAATVIGIYKAFESFNESAKATQAILKGIDDAIKQIDEDTQSLIRTNRDLALQNKIDAGEIAKVNGERLKAQNRFKDEYLAIVKKTLDAQKKLNEDAEKAREDDGFKGTKRVFEALGGETDLTKAQKQGLKGIQEAHNKEILELQKKFGLENSKILIDEANEEEKKRKEANDKLKQFIEAELSLRTNLKKKLSDLEKQDTGFNIENREGSGSIKQLTAQFELRKQILFEETKAEISELKKQRDAISKEGLLTNSLKKKFAEDEILINKISAQAIINLNQEKRLALINQETKNGQDLIERKRLNEELLLTGLTDSEVNIANQRLLIQTEYYNSSIKLAEKDIEKRKALGFDVVVQEKALTDLRIKAQVDSAKAIEDINKQTTDAAIRQNELKESQSDTQLKLQNSRHSTELFNELKFEQDKLAILEAGGKAYIDEAKRQADKVALIEKEAVKQRRLENISYYEQISQAALSSTNKIIDTKIKEIDQQSTLQQRRVDEAKGIADQGNAELLELEKERLENLNKEKEKFVRAQQALAAIELISNTAIAVSKAAAEGGAAAGITIAAALLALVAGLASARSIASQAAFYDGGYTGDGNPRDISNAIGPRNYTYHKGEFVFDHEKTGKYKDIFQGIHDGKIDLGNWREKVMSFDYLTKLNSMNTQVPMFMPPAVVNNTVEIRELKGQMEQLINVVKGQTTEFNVDSRGFTMRLKGILDRDNFLKDSAKA